MRVAAARPDVQSFVQRALEDHGVLLAAGISAEGDPLTAAAQACERVLATPGLPRISPDLVLAFLSTHHAWAMRSICGHIERLLTPRHIGASTAEAVLGGTHELEGVPGISLMAMWLPGVRISPFLIDDLILEDDIDDDAQIAAIERAMDAGPDLRASIVVLDPHSVPITRLLPAMNRARRGNRVPIVGGMASGARTPDGGGNVMLLDDRVIDRGGIGVSLSGPVRVDAVVSQGCRPFGPNLVVTKCRGNLILEFGSRPALQVVQELVESMTHEEREVLRKGIFLGRVVDEYKERFGVGDFLIRGIVGADKDLSALAVGEVVRVGQTVRLHVRDAATATNDLSMLLDGQKLHGRPAGALLFTCNSRGRRLFSTPSHDVGALQRAFRRPSDGPELAKGGTAIASDPRELALAGFFAAGEIGPIGRDTYLHGHTACAALFRSE